MGIWDRYTDPLPGQFAKMLRLLNARSIGSQRAEQVTGTSLEKLINRQR